MSARLGATLMTGLTMRRLSTVLGAAFILAALASVSPAQTNRVAHTATLLPNGDLLIAGGVDETGAAQSSAELFALSQDNIIIPTGGMGVAVASHTATLMTNGCVLVAGGNSAGDLAAPFPESSARVYNPGTGTWTPTGAMGTARYNHTATLLNTGNVLICGGQDAAGNAIGQCELYTPTSCTGGAFTAPGAAVMLQARYSHTATLLKDGRVYFAGGRNPTAVATQFYLTTAERFNPGTNSFQSASPLIEARAHHTATLMGDGKVLLVGGYNKRDVLANTGITQSAEIYDPISNSVTPASAMETRRQSHAAVLSANGEVTVFGGLGNITTTYVAGSELNTDPVLMLPGSSMVFGPPTATPNSTIVAGSAGSIKLDFLLNKPVIGEIEDGEILMSSPTITASWGVVRFTTASQTNSAIGLRSSLKGAPVSCRKPPGIVIGNCGDVNQIGVFTNLQGTVVFYPTDFVGTGNVTAGSLSFSGTLDDTNTNRTLTGGSFTTNVKFTVDKAFIGHIISGSIALTDGTLVQPSSFTVTLTGATGAIPGGTTVTAAPTGKGQVIASITFNALAGTIDYNGTNPQSFTTPIAAIPLIGAGMTSDLTGILNYTTNGADVVGETFVVDVATVIVRKMLFADAETFSPKANSWVLAPVPGGDWTDHRFGHSATLLTSNDSVYYGGRACNGATCSSQVATSTVAFQLLYSEKNFAATAGSAAQARAFHTSTMLSDGTILVAGGTDGPSILSHSELFDPTSQTFSPINGSMNYVRDLHTATLLPNGRVLIAGGFTTNAFSTGSTNTVELYYPETKRFIETTPMISSRSNHGAIMLPDGRVFVAGGFGPDDVITPTSEIFISTQNRWIAALNMPGGCERALHSTVQLRDGRILLIGGVNASGPLSTSALYDPVTNTWDCAATAQIGAGTPSGVTALRSHTATMLFDGRVLVAGGNDGLGEANRSYIYDPGANSWAETDPLPLLFPRFNHTANLLPNGNVLITGGSQRFGEIPPAHEVYHINGSSWVTGGSVFATGARAFHTVTLALNNLLVAIGGSDGVIGGAGTALYTSAEAGYFGATPDAFSKNAPPSVRQSTASSTSATPFLPSTNLTVGGLRFRGGDGGLRRRLRFRQLLFQLPAPDHAAGRGFGRLCVTIERKFRR